MNPSGRVILFTSDEAAAPDLRRRITVLPRVKIVAELDEPSLLAHAVAQFPADVLVVDIDRMTDVVLECVAQLGQSSPALAVFALSDNTEGDIVLRSMRAGMQEYLVKPLDAEDWARALSRVVANKPAAQEPGKLISVMGSAGGVGATMLSTNLAVELAALCREDQRVAIVDLDFRFGQVATLLDVHSQFTVADLCATPEQLDPQMIMKALVHHPSGVYVLTRPHSFGQAEMITAAHCASVLTGLQELCEYVVVDGPTRHDQGARIVLDASDHILFVLQLLVTSARNTDRMLQELSVQGFNADRVSLVCNRLGRDSAHLEIAHVEQTLNRKMYVTIPDDWRTVSSSINVGRPLKVDFARSKVRSAIARLAMMLHDPDALAVETDHHGGLLGKLFRKGTKPEEPATEVVSA